MTPVQKFRKYMPVFFLTMIWLVVGCGSFALGSRPLSQPEILATADAIRTRTPQVRTEVDDDIAQARAEQTYQAMYDEYLESKQHRYDSYMATEAAVFTAEALAEDDRWNDATMEVIDATADANLATYEAGRVDCAGGCTDYPTWCDKAPIKGNVSFSSGERIFHMQGDEFYEETRINPEYGEYYFCTAEEAEAAGFRRAYN